jgi:hypothetical protein
MSASSTFRHRHRLIGLIAILGIAIGLIAIRNQFVPETRFTKELSDQIEPGMP